MLNNNTEISKKVIELVAYQTSIRSEKISLESRLNFELGIDGDDAIELLEEFSKQFNVDLSNFQYDKYFGPEGGGDIFSLIFWTLYWIYCKVLRKPYNPPYSIDPITIQDLVNAVEIGRLEI